jgi:hypothetical protein
VNAGTRKDFITGKVAVVWKTVGKKAVWKARPKQTDLERVADIIRAYAYDWSENPKTGRLEAYFKFDEKGRVVR